MPSKAPLELAALAASFITLALGGSAHAALDPLCGTTITTNTTLTGDVDCIGFTGNAITIGANNVTFDGAGFKLVAPDAAIAVRVIGRTGTTIKNLDVSGWCLGYGIYIQNGSNNTVDTVIADGRQYGFYFDTTSGITARNLSSDSASASAMFLSSVTLPVTLDHLSLTNATYGL